MSNKRDLYQAQRLLAKYGTELLPEIIKQASTPKPRKGRPPLWKGKTQVEVFLSVEALKQAGLKAEQAKREFAEFVGPRTKSPGPLLFTPNQVEKLWREGRDLVGKHFKTDRRRLLEQHLATWPDLKQRCSEISAKKRRI
jgi:hypothetical protein